MRFAWLVGWLVVLLHCICIQQPNPYFVGRGMVLTLLCRVETLVEESFHPQVLWAVSKCECTNAVSCRVLFLFMVEVGHSEYRVSLSRVGCGQSHSSSSKCVHVVLAVVSFMAARVIRERKEERGREGERACSRVLRLQ